MFQYSDRLSQLIRKEAQLSIGLELLTMDANLEEEL